MENEDYKIVRLCLKGKNEAYAKLVEKYSRRVYNLAYRLTSNAEKSKDISQEAFIKVYKSLDKYDPKYKFSSWLLKTVSNLCIDYHRSKAHQTASLEVILEGRAESLLLYDEAIRNSDANGLDDRLEAKELRALIREGIELLPMDYKSVVVMRHIQNYSYKEISDILNLPMGTIKARIHRARKLLKTYLEGKLADYR